MKPQIIYTPTGKKEIGHYLNEQQELLEKYILQEKYIIGDEIVEITGSDVVKIKQELDVMYKKTTHKSKALNALKSASLLYVIFGALVSLIGFSYPFIRDIIVYNRQQALIIFTGLTILLLGLFLCVYVKNRERRELERRELERFRTESNDETEVTLSL